MHPAVTPSGACSTICVPSPAPPVPSPVPYGWPEEDGLVVIDVIERDLEGLHGLVGGLALVAGHDDQLGREAKAPSWAKPRGRGGFGDIAEAGTERGRLGGKGLLWN